MIPKVIHYCWFGKTEEPEEVLRCIDTWKRHCPGYQIIRWDEGSFNVNSVPYTKDAYAEQCWTKVSNYVRFWALHEYGGIYLDTDIELYKNLDSLLINECFFGLEHCKRYPFYQNDFRNTLFGTAIIGCEKGNETIGRILDYYKTKVFTQFERTPESNSVLLITNLFKDDILNRCTIYSRHMLYPDNPTDISYCKHLKFDMWRKDRV